MPPTAPAPARTYLPSRRSSYTGTHCGRCGRRRRCTRAGGGGAALGARGLICRRQRCCTRCPPELVHRDALRPLREAATLHALGRRVKHGPTGGGGEGREAERQSCSSTHSPLFAKSASSSPRDHFTAVLHFQWSPSDSCIRAKTIYAVSRNQFRHELNGVHFEIQATDSDDMDLEVLRGHANRT